MIAIHINKPHIINNQQCKTDNVVLNPLAAALLLRNTISETLVEVVQRLKPMI